MIAHNRILDNLLTEFDKLEDPRRGAGRRHSQSFALLIVMFATMSGYLGYRAIKDFIAKHESDLITIFKPPKDRVPSYSTVRRILIHLNFTQFTTIYKTWLNQYLQTSSGPSSWCGVDGKALRGTIESDDYNDYVHLVSIFSTFDKIVLDIGKVANKSNEIPLVQQMIKDSVLQEVIFTLDALHCQKKPPKSL